MRLRLQQEDNCSGTNRYNDEDNQRRNDGRQAATPKRASLDLLREMRKEMDELRSAIKEKTDWSLDKMVKRTDSPFMTTVLECPMMSKFRLPQLEPFDKLKDPLITSTLLRQL